MSKLYDRWVVWEKRVSKLKAILKTDVPENIPEWADKATGLMIEGLDLVGDTMKQALMPTIEED